MKRTKLLTLGNRAFTIMELMVVVFIISILAATVLPLVGRYLKKSKTAEASLNLRKIYDGEVGYYQQEVVLSSGALASKSFVSAPQTPSSPTNQKQLGNFENTVWSSLKFSPDGPVLYSYSVDAAGRGTSSSFTARAEGDIDGDGTTSLFERVASVDPATGEVAGGAAIFSIDELE